MFFSEGHGLWQIHLKEHHTVRHCVFPGASIQICFFKVVIFDILMQSLFSSFMTNSCTIKDRHVIIKQNEKDSIVFHNTTKLFSQLIIPVSRVIRPGALPHSCAIFLSLAPWVANFNQSDGFAVLVLNIMYIENAIGVSGKHSLHYFGLKSCTGHYVATCLTISQRLVYCLSLFSFMLERMIVVFNSFVAEPGEGFSHQPSVNSTIASMEFGISFGNQLNPYLTLGKERFIVRAYWKIVINGDRRGLTID
jgi:hypothetical protein